MEVHFLLGAARKLVRCWVSSTWACLSSLWKSSFSKLGPKTMVYALASFIWWLRMFLHGCKSATTCKTTPSQCLPTHLQLHFWNCVPVSRCVHRRLPGLDLLLRMFEDIWRMKLGWNWNQLVLSTGWTVFQCFSFYSISQCPFPPPHTIEQTNTCSWKNNMIIFSWNDCRWSRLLNHWRNNSWKTPWNDFPLAEPAWGQMAWPPWSQLQRFSGEPCFALAGWTKTWFAGVKRSKLNPFCMSFCKPWWCWLWFVEAGGWDPGIVQTFFQRNCGFIGILVGFQMCF